jgi:hypothetical protein
MAILLTVAIIAAIPYIVGPLLLWLNGSRMLPTDLEPADPSRALPTAAESHFWKTTHYFGSNGFDKVGDRIRESARNGLAFYKQLWRHGQSGEVALVGAILKDSDPAYCNAFVALIHERDNGALISTSNFNVGARVVLDPPGTSKVVVPYQDPSVLRSLHQAHLAALAGESIRPLRVRDPYAFSKQLDAATRETGLLQRRFRPDGDALRVTLWGAFFGIWVNLPPLKGMYERRERELLDRVLRAGAAAGLPSLKRSAAA